MSFRYLFAYLLELLKKSRTSKVISPLSLNGFNTTADNWTPPLVVLKDPVSYLTQKITNKCTFNLIQFLKSISKTYVFFHQLHFPFGTVSIGIKSNTAQFLKLLF